MSTVFSSIAGNSSYHPTTTNVKSNPTQATQESTTDSTGDVLTISAERLAAYAKAGKAQLYQPSDLNIDINSRAPQVSGDLRTWEKIAASSKHISPLAWAMGIEHADPSGGSLYSTKDVELVREKVRATAESLDDKIGGILKSNNIVLGEDETLNFKVSQDGKISVGDGVSGDKREKIEKLLNEDKSLGKELVFAHAQRSYADQGMTSPNAIDRKLLLDDLLQKEYGVSINDFERRELSNDSPVGQSGLICKTDEGLADQLLQEETMLHDMISMVLYTQEEGRISANAEFGFSYKNGVTVEKGSSDEATLDKYSTSFLTRAHHLTSAAESGKLDYSATIDAQGNILNVAVNSYNGKSDAATQKEQTDFLRHFLSFSSDATHWNSFSNQSTLRQFAFDSQRLNQFKTGSTAQESTITFGTKATR